MKCTPIRLHHRSELSRWTLDRNIQKIRDPVYITRECNWYSFTFVRNASIRPKSQNLSVKNLQLPENFNSYNSGYSLEKWYNKQPRLKSSKNKRKNSAHILQNDDDKCDINDIINSLDTSEETQRDDFDTVDYEINSDIEELFRKSKEYEASEKMEQRRQEEKQKNSKRKLKHKLKKTIRFSFSKPASPETEQVIRVDVTSNVSIDELKQFELNKGDSRKHHKKVNGGNKLAGSFHNEEEECIIRCSQLALTTKR